MKFNDIVWGIVLMTLGIAVLNDVRTYPDIPGQQYGPNAFPGLLAVLLIGCATGLIVKGIKERAQHPWMEAGVWLQSAPHVRNFALTVGALIFYVVAADKAGFLICGTVILAVMFWSLDVSTKLIAPIAVISTLVIHLIFYKGLRVPLPWGVIPVLY
jgi:putative tricarboxylic transport membrane protein